ncbi:MAG: tetratricopeptide repeat protein [bacterium]|nr:tetratricopeptide repeat protein [bacterium]
MKRIILLFFLSFFIALNIHAQELSKTQESSKKALELDKKAVENEVISSYRLGIVYGLNGLYDEAIKHLKKAIKIDPLFSEAYRILGIVYSLQDNYSEAIRNLERAVQINPNSKDAYHILKIINGLKNDRKRIEELSVQEKEYKKLEKKADFEIDYSEIKTTLSRMEKEIEKLKRNQDKRKHLASEVYRSPKEKERLKTKPRKVASIKETYKMFNHKDEKRVNKVKKFADILEEEKEVAFVDEGIAHQPKTVVLKRKFVKGNYIRLKKTLELTIISLQGLWGKDKDSHIFYIEGELENTGSSCVYKPRINAKFFYKNELLGVANCHPKSKINVGEIVGFRLSLPISIDCQKELSYQLSIKEDELTLNKERSIQLFMMVENRKIEMPIIFH